jgi:LysR family glycine cleavage system transcriptional activator
LRNLRAFCVAAQHRSFKLAADELFLTPSAVSHQMKELEQALGVRLFERKTRAVELTAAGHTLYDEVGPLLDAIDRSVARIARRNRRTTLRLQLPPFFASELFIPRIGSFCEAYPDIDIQVDTHDPRPSVHPPTTDLSVLLAEEEPQGLNVTRLFSLSLVAACTPAHAATVARLGSGALRELALIVHKTRPFAWSSWAQEIGLGEPEPKNVIELDTMFAVVRAAERGVGIALVPQALCGSWFDSGALVRAFPAQFATNDAYFLASRIKDADRPEVAAMTRWMREHCTRLPELNESSKPAADARALERPAGPPARAEEAQAHALATPAASARR